MVHVSSLLVAAGLYALRAKATWEPGAADVLAAAAVDEFAKYVNFEGVAGAAQNITNGVGSAVQDLAERQSSTYWYEMIAHQGVAAFNPTSGYKVFRNVKDYGAVGDGTTDDTQAIQNAIADGGRYAPSSGKTQTNQPAVVYFPCGTYKISSSIIDYYFTQIIGNPNCMPVLQATSGIQGFGVIDGDQYQPGGALAWKGVNTFFRQIRNLVIDLTNCPASAAVTGIHWPTGQATSIQNVQFLMSQASGTQHQGVFIEEGSAGFIGDLTFTGGKYGLNVGNQQYTMRNLKFENVQTAINQLWDWGWTYKSLDISNCSVALDISGLNNGQVTNGATVMIDSIISDTPIGIKTARGPNSSPSASGALALENVRLQNVPIAVQGPDGTHLQGTSGSGTLSITAYAEGSQYKPNGPTNVEGTITPNMRPASLLGSNGFYERSKPQYQTLPVSSFLSVRKAGAAGNGVADDTAAVQKAITNAAKQGKVVFFDAGTYKVTKTILVPPGSKMVGESYSNIMGSGAFFSKILKPQPVVQVGNAGQSGRVEWSDMIVSTQGGPLGTGGAILIQWNLVSPASNPSGMWDVHTRIGGAVGSKYELSTCPSDPSTNVTQRSQVQNKCIAAYMAFHITPSASGLYLENNWFWTADHDIDANTGGADQITIYSGRGVLDQSKNGAVSLWATSSEHHVLYQYQFAGTKNTVMGQIQTETAYYQPNPDAHLPFPTNKSLADPTFPTGPYTSGGVSIPNADGWGLRVVNSANLLVYGAGHYAFFKNYDLTCSNPGDGSDRFQCQSRMVSITNSTPSFYDIHTIGNAVMVALNGNDVAKSSDNPAGFTAEVGVFRT